MTRSILDRQAIRPRAFSYPLGVWVLMVIVAIVNGGLREVVLIPRIVEYPGHVVSTTLLVVAILTISFLFFSRISIAYTPVELLLVGVLWTVLTVGFEFLVGYIERTPVSVTMGQYDITAGQVWVVVPLALLVSPILFGWYFSH